MKDTKQSKEQRVSYAKQRSVLVTGASGGIGKAALRSLAGDGRKVIALDLHSPSAIDRLQGVDYRELDVRSPALVDLLREQRIDVVVHLAAMLEDRGPQGRERAFSVDVLGTQNVINACVEASVGRLVVTSSGAAYGYHHDNPEWIDETQALRGNEAFTYSRNKCLVEELLANARREHPELAQVVFRPGTVLGAEMDSPVTALFDKPVMLGVRESETRFVLIWEDDVAAALLRGVDGDEVGIYNLAGDGYVTLAQIAEAQGKRCIALPARWVATGLSVLSRLGLTRYGPEQVDFIRYRPVLSNRRLKEELGYTPRYDSREALTAYLAARDCRNAAAKAARAQA